MLTYLLGLKGSLKKLESSRKAQKDKAKLMLIVSPGNRSIITSVMPGTGISKVQVTVSGKDFYSKKRQ